MVKSVDEYLELGCGRCKHFATPACKVNRWKQELSQLRSLALQCGLQEHIKWGVPCYTWNATNVLLIGAFNEYCVISFFLGEQLSDPYNILQLAGPNSQAGRVIRITGLADIESMWNILLEYVEESKKIAAVEKKRTPKLPPNYSMPAELSKVLDQDKSLQAAFDRLTPGRKRGFVIYISQPKSAEARLRRIEKCKPMILAGKGLHDR